MTRPTLFLAAAALSGFALVACSQEGGDVAVVAPASAAEPAVAASGAKAILPGLWEITRTSSDSDPEVSQDCVTPEQAEWSAQAVAAGAQAGACKLVKNQVGGGRLDIRTTCGGQAEAGLGASEMRMSGAYTPTTYDVDFAMRTKVNGEPVDIVTKTKGRRVAAACPAEPAE